MAGDEYIWKDDSNFIKYIISFKVRAKKFVERNVKVIVSEDWSATKKREKRS